MQAFMKHKIFIFYMVIGMAITMFPVGACAALQTKAGKTLCE